MNLIRSVVTSCCLLFACVGYGQAKYKFFEIKPNKGKVFVSFGWNRGYFSNSDLHCEGEDYKFTLHALQAQDRPSEFDFDLYFNPTTFTIPQTNFKVGYFFHNNYIISFGIDHMKYVMVQNQTAEISGYIAIGNNAYDGNYDRDKITIATDFLTFEHTNGLNYLSLELNRHDDLLKLLKLENKWVEVSVAEGFSAGVITPKTDARLLGKPRNDVFYLAGYGLGANIDLSVTFFQHLYFQLGIKGGFIHLPDVKTTASLSDKAHQNFWFFQHIFSFGFKVKIFR